ncbi:hypothetical protein EW145_g7966, partial [Phellinidium pouzarii]
MTGYIRGGVQMPYKANANLNPALQLATTYASTSAAGLNAQYQTYGAYALQQQQQQYGTGYAATTAAGYAQRLSQTLMDDYERMPRTTCLFGCSFSLVFKNKNSEMGGPTNRGCWTVDCGFWTRRAGWYTESSPTNRMLLALRSGLDSEVGWALERLCRLSFNEQFTLASIPGLTDALFEWPEWFLDEYANGSKNEQKSLAHTRARAPLLSRALTALAPHTDDHTQFVLYALDLLQALAGTYVLPPPRSGSGTDDGLPSLVPALERLAEGSSNRAVIVGALTALTMLLGVQQNATHNTATSPALTACIRYLPLFQDSALVDTCLNFFYVHLSYPPMTRAFLLHPDMPNVVKLLAAYIISQQVEETRTIDITGPIHTVPVVKVQSIPYELTNEEKERIGTLPEPERCFEWLRTALVSNPNEELTQVEFWNAYKDHFASFQERHPLLVASEVIKNASVAFPNAAAMVLPGPPQKFIIRGITKRKKVIIVENNICQWNHSQCVPESFKTPADLHAHVQIHVDILREQSEAQTTNFSCTWGTCQHTAPSTAALVQHVWTHLPLKNSAFSKATSQSIDPSQLPQITLASANEQYPIADATQRTPPPPPRTAIAYPAPAGRPVF